MSPGVLVYLVVVRLDLIVLPSILRKVSEIDVGRCDLRYAPPLTGQPFICEMDYLLCVRSVD